MKNRLVDATIYSHAEETTHQFHMDVSRTAIDQLAAAWQQAFEDWADIETWAELSPAACGSYLFDPKHGTHKLRKYDVCKNCGLPAWAHRE